jgi:hypothetical protein
MAQATEAQDVQKALSGEEELTDSILATQGKVPFDRTSAEEEHTFHHYTGNAIPWFVRGVWIVFWCFAITYVLVWLIPSLQSELLSPP